MHEPNPATFFFCRDPSRPGAASQAHSLHAVLFVLSPPPPVLLHHAAATSTLKQHSDRVCTSLMDSVVAASNGKTSGVPKVSMYDVRNYELGRQFPPGHAYVEVIIRGAITPRPSVVCACCLVVLSAILPVRSYIHGGIFLFVYNL